MSDIVTLGELIIDFTELNDEKGEICYKRNAGGAPANVACMAARLGADAAFIGKIGKDMFGEYLKGVLDEYNVNTKGIIMDKELSTTLAFVRKNEDGNRDYVFYRKNSADLNLNFNEINLKMIDECKIFHFGALSLTSDPSRTATLKAVEYAKSKGKIISYDPNWRPLLWKSKDNAIKTMKEALQYADIVKVSESELSVVTDSGNLIPSIAQLLNGGVKIVCVTQGAKGCIIATKKILEKYPAYKVTTVDTMGSGDSFFGAFLYKLLEKNVGISELTSDDIDEMAIFANACGSITSAKLGAIPAMPTLDEVREFMENNKPASKY